MRLFFRFAALAVAVGLFTVALPLTALAGERQHDDEPTIVLVHGAWAGPSSWASVVHRLRDEDFRTVTPTLGLTSLAGDVATVNAVLNQIPGKKILVGHSYGGAVISGASAGRSDVLALVYSAAFVPDAGDSLASLGAGFNPSGVIPHLLWAGPPFAPGSLASIDPAFFPQFFAQDLPVAQSAALGAPTADRVHLGVRDGVRTGGLAHHPVLGSGVWSGPDDRPGARPLHGCARRIHDD
jgi:pimeloyl-ACP methyl ester carboxylesterase